MIARVLPAAALACTLASQVHAQPYREPVGFSARPAPSADSAQWPEAARKRCERDRMTIIVSGPVGGYLAGLLAHSLKGPWEGPKPPGHAAERQRWGLAGAAIGLVIGVIQASQIECPPVGLGYRPRLSASADTTAESREPKPLAASRGA